MKQLEEIYQVRKVGKPSWIQRFFILCSGAEKEILFQCRTEWNKYAGIGGTIFFTGLLASLSGGYALYTIFRGEANDFAYGLLFGITWGVVILNLDRFIVSSIRKEGNLRKELLQASPRFILAIIISIVIAKPLEVMLFENRIQAEIENLKLTNMEINKTRIDTISGIGILKNDLTILNDRRSELKELLVSDPKTPNFIELKKEYNANKIEYNTIRITNNDLILKINRDISFLDSKVIVEQDKIDDLKLKKGKLIDEIYLKRKLYHEAEALYNKSILEHKLLVGQQLKDTDNKISIGEEKYSNADSARITLTNVSHITSEKAFSNNFITQLEALGSLTDSNSMLRLTSWMIMLLFIIIETAPILVKLLSKRGPYDEILDRVEYENYINEKAHISRLNSKINELLDKSREAAKLEGDVFMQVEKQRLDHELQNNQKILDDLAQKQEYLAKIAIDNWYQIELTKTNSSPIQQLQITRPKLEDIFWRQKVVVDKIEYYFRNGSLPDKELLYFENEKLNTGKWKFNRSQDEIAIELLNNKAEYLIVEINNTTLKLKDKVTNDFIEFEKV